MDSHYGLSLICYRSLYPGLVDIHCIRANIDEYRRGACQHDGCGGARKGETGKDHFVAFFKSAQQCCHFQRGGAAGGQKSADRAEALFNPCVAFLCKLAISADLVRVDGLLYILNFRANIGRNIEWNICHKL